jgi:hypothetical protein
MYLYISIISYLIFTSAVTNELKNLQEKMNEYISIYEYNSLKEKMIEAITENKLFDENIKLIEISRDISLQNLSDCEVSIFDFVRI